MDKQVVLDFSDCEYIGSIHNVIRDGLNLPEYYGANLDALWDMLTGYIETPICIKIKYNPKKQKAKALNYYIDKIVNVCKDAEAETPNLKVVKMQ